MQVTLIGIGSIDSTKEGFGKVILNKHDLNGRIAITLTLTPKGEDLPITMTVAVQGDALRKSVKLLTK